MAIALTGSKVRGRGVLHRTTVRWESPSSELKPWFWLVHCEGKREEDEIAEVMGRSILVFVAGLLAGGF